MFNPWYAGPLLTPSAHTLPGGYVNIEPYLFWTNTFATYDKSGKSHQIPNIHTLNPQLPVLIGLTDWLNLVLSAQYVRNKQKGMTGTGWGDSGVGLNFQLLKEAPYTPAILFAVKETFPTGRYQRLNPKKGGMDGIGAGSYQTTLSLNLSKLVWWLTLHPMNFRFSFNYTLPAPVKVHRNNSYGGGPSTHGTVRPGKSFQGDIGYEYSFTQRWVAALDIVYTYQSKSTFSGHAGSTAGVPNTVGRPFNDQLSLAPALEYNPNENLNFIAGLWFTVYGRNSSNFLSGVFAIEYTFKL